MQFVGFWLAGKNTSARDKFAAKTSLAVSSMEYCGRLFDERDIRMSLGSDRMTGHKLFPLRSSLSRERPDDLSRSHGQFCLVTNSCDQPAVL
jgi:hypothetical protein